MKKNFAFHSLIVSTILFSLLSCKKEESPNPEPVNPTQPNNAIYVINEGSFGSQSGTISLIDRSTGKITSDIFGQVNQRPLGDVVQSMHIYGDKGYVVVNNSNKIEVVNLSDFKSVATITGLQSPRYMVVINDTLAMATQWSFPGSVAVISLKSYQVIKNIQTGEGPEQIIKSGNRIFVCNSGGFGGDNKITVLDFNGNILSQLNTGDSPASMAVDSNNKLWVLCAGKKTYSSQPPYNLDTANCTPGKLQSFVLNNLQKESDFTFDDKTQIPSSLTINKSGNTLFYIYKNGVHPMATGSQSLPSIPLIGKAFYGINIDPVNDDIWCADPGNFQSAGNAYRYDNTGKLTGTFKTGIGTARFTFN
jgi:hypothetical protein